MSTAAAKAIVYQLDSKGRTWAVYNSIENYATGTGITSYCVLADGRVVLKWPADVRQAGTAELSRAFGCQLAMLYVAFFDEDPASAGLNGRVVLCAGDFTEPLIGSSNKRLDRKRVASEEEEGCRTGGGSRERLERKMSRRGMRTRSRQYTELCANPSAQEDDNRRVYGPQQQQQQQQASEWNPLSVRGVVKEAVTTTEDEGEPSGDIAE